MGVDFMERIILDTITNGDANSFMPGLEIHSTSHWSHASTISTEVLGTLIHATTVRLKEVG